MKRFVLRTVMVLALAGLGIVVAGFTYAPYGKKIKMVVSGKTSFKRMYGMPGWTPVTPPDVEGKSTAATSFMGFFKGQYEAGKYTYTGIFAGVFQGQSIVYAKSPLVSGNSSSIIDAGGAWLPVAAGRGSVGAFVHSQFEWSSTQGKTNPVEYYLREFDAQGNPVGPAKKILSSPPPKTSPAAAPLASPRTPTSDYPSYWTENNLTFAFTQTGRVYLGFTESWNRYTAGDAGPARYDGPLSSQFWQMYTTKYQGASTQWKKQLWKAGAETDSVITSSQAFDSTNWAVGVVNTYDVPAGAAGERGYSYPIRNDLYSFQYTYAAASPLAEAPAGRKVSKIASTDQGGARSYQSAQVLLDENGDPADMVFYQFRDTQTEPPFEFELYVARYFFQPMKNGNPSGSPIEITVPVWKHKINPGPNMETTHYDELISELVPVGQNRYLAFMSRNLSVAPPSKDAGEANPASANTENQLNVVLFNIDKKTGSFVGNLILGMRDQDYLEKATLMSSGGSLLFYLERVNDSDPDWNKHTRESCWASATVEDFVQD